MHFKSEKENVFLCFFLDLVSFLDKYYDNTMIIILL